MRIGAQRRKGESNGGGWLVALLVIGVVVYFAANKDKPGLGIGGQSAEDKTKQAVLFILKEDDRIAKATKGHLNKDSSPIQVAQAIANYCSQADGLNVSDCPADFRVAYRHHIQAWRELQRTIQELPDDFLQGVFQGQRI